MQYSYIYSTSHRGLRHGLKMKKEDNFRNREKRIMAMEIYFAQKSQQVNNGM